MSTASNAAKTPISTPKINAVPRPDRNVATTGAAIPAAGALPFGQECLSSEKGELVELLPAVRDDTQDRQCYMVWAAMLVNMLDVSNIAVFVGRDVGKSEDHAAPVDLAGAQLASTRLQQDKSRMRDFIVRLQRRGRSFLSWDSQNPSEHCPPALHRDAYYRVWP